MNILLWVLQALIAIHTAIGAVWKFSNTAEQTMPTLAAIPQWLWISMSFFELICSVALILPAFNKRLAILAPLAAAGIALEMIVFSIMHMNSENAESGPVVYWMVVAGLCAVIFYGRFVRKQS